MSFPSRAILAIAMSLFLFLSASSQAGFDFQNTKVDDLSDAQIKDLVAKAESLGYSENDIYLLAESEGVSSEEIEKLKKRIADINNPKPDVEKAVEKVAAKEEVKSVVNEKKDKTLKPFGFDLFNPDTRKLSFETNLLIPTPEDYVLGPADEVTINIYGASEKNYLERVRPGGSLLIPNIGPIYVSGLTLKAATARIRSKLSTLYNDLNSSSPNTFVEVAISQVRTMKVNLVGELMMPGTYTVNGLSTVFNAVYVAGGPNKNGTLRDIKVFRANRLISTIDYYDFLVRGITKTNVRLQNDDIIMVGPRLERVTIEGQVKRPGIYEMREGETVEDLLLYCGGFSEQAYARKIAVTRNTDTEKMVSDVYDEQFSLFEIKAGDQYRVQKILDRYANRVSVKGSVFRPGSYSLTENMTIKKLVERADGITGDAFLKRAVVIRTKKDLSTETINVNLAEILENGEGDILLKREDVLNILSIYDIKEEAYVKISGEVNKGGVYAYSENMTVQDLIFLADGFTQASDKGVIEISRRPESQSAENLAEVIQISLEEGLLLMDDLGGEVTLKPYDHVFVRRNPNYFSEKTVEVNGQVKYPGRYTLLSQRERISDLLNRGGGLKEAAYIEGATLIRNTEFFRSENEIESRKRDLEQVLSSLDQEFLSEADEKLIDEIYDELNNQYIFPESDEVNVATKTKRERLIDFAKKNPFLDGFDIKKTESIAIDLQEILRRPGGPEDLLLEDGDIISIPKELKTIRLRGRVLYPNTVRFEKGQKLDHYIDKAGGFGLRARKGSTYIVYANGEVSRTKRFLFFRTFPKPEPGSEVIVPAKPFKVPLKPSEIIGLTSGLATLAVLVTQLIQLNQN